MYLAISDHYNAKQKTEERDVPRRKIASADLKGPGKKRAVGRGLEPGNQAACRSN